MKKMVTMGLISTILLTGLNSNLVYATVDQGNSEVTEKTESTTKTSDQMVPSVTNAANSDSAAEEKKATNDSTAEQQNSQRTVQKQTTATTATSEAVLAADAPTENVRAAGTVTFPATVSEIFPDENLAKYMASSLALDIPMNQKITEEFLANWQGNSTEGQPNYFSIASYYGAYDSLEGLQYLTNIRQMEFAVGDGGVTTDDFTVLQHLPRLTSLNITTDALSPASLAVIAQLPNLKELQLAANISDLTPFNQPNVQIETLDISGNPVTSLEPLRAFTHLKTLKCNSTGITNFTGIEALPLEELEAIMCSSLSDLSALTNSHTLKVLNASLCDISDLTPLANLTSLVELGLFKNTITSIEPLKNLVNLEILSVGMNQVTDITPIQKMTKLYNLELMANNISDIQVIKNLTALNYLGIEQNKITTIEPLRSLNFLNQVRMARNQVLDFSPLQNKQLTISGEGQEVHVKGKRTGEQVTIDYLTKSIDGSVLTPDTISDNGTYNSTSNQIVWSDLAVGTESFYTFDQQFENPGNVSEVSRISGTVYVDGIEDNEAPIITADDKINYEMNSTVTANDFLKGIHASTDDGSPIESDFAQVVDLTTPGDYEVTLTAKDAVGNEAAPVKVIVTVTEPKDTTPPVIIADDQANYEVNTTVTEDDFLKEIQAKTDDGSTVESDFAQVVDLNTPGRYEVTLTAKDAAGNEATPVKVIVTVTAKAADKTPDDATDTPPATSDQPQAPDDQKQGGKGDQTANINQGNKNTNNISGTNGSNTGGSSTSDQQSATSLPNTGATSTSMYSVLLGMLLLVISGGGYLKRRKKEDARS